MDHTEHILSNLETLRVSELAAARDDTSARFKALAYKKAIDSIKSLKKSIRTADDVKGLPGIGEKIQAKIQTIIETGTLARVERVRESTADMAALLRVHGIGPVKARALMDAGIHSIAALREAVRRDPRVLNAAQHLGLKHYEDSLERIPRAEMTQHERQLRSVLATSRLEHDGMIVGSYRRGMSTSGDIDLLVTYNPRLDVTEAEDYFQDYVADLRRTGYIVDTLVCGSKKWMGYVRHAPTDRVRRLDMLLTAPATFPYAVLYFTGSDKFNVAMRKYCLEHNYSLNEYGLQPLNGAVPPPPMATEDDIFAFLGLAYVAPELRVDERSLRRRGL